MTVDQMALRARRALGAVLLVLLALVLILKVTGVSSPAAVTGPVDTGANVALGQKMAAAYDWGAGSQWTCLNELWTRESGWQQLIQNPQSGAFGIAQALGHGGSGTQATVAVVYYPGGGSASNVTVNEYPSSAANSGDASAQVSWGLEDIKSVYGSPCGAWAHETADGWY